jgi:hypothetical protein
MLPTLRHLSLLAAFSVGSACLMLKAAAQDAGAAPVLSEIVAVRDLSREEAARDRRAEVQGVITFMHPERWYFFIEEKGESLFIQNPREEIRERHRAGDRVLVRGVVELGKFTPIIKSEGTTFLQHEGSPVPLSATASEMMSGALDGRFVETHGVFRRTTVDEVPFGAEADLLMDSGGVTLRVHVPGLTRAAADELVNAAVSIRGICLSNWTGDGQFVTPRLCAETLEDITIVRAAPADPWSAPAFGINELLQFRRDSTWQHRVMVRGTVTHCRKNLGVFLTAGGHGLFVQARAAEPLVPGDLVEAVGFATPGSAKPWLDDALIRKVGSGTPPLPRLRKRLK